jgi:hypothetical protein
MYRFSTSALAGGGWSTSRRGRFTLGERALGTHWIGDWVGPRTGFDVVKRKILPGLELRPLSVQRNTATRTALNAVFVYRNQSRKGTPMQSYIAVGRRAVNAA